MVKILVLGLIVAWSGAKYVSVQNMYSKIETGTIVKLQGTVWQSPKKFNTLQRIEMGKFDVYIPADNNVYVFDQIHIVGKVNKGVIKKEQARIRLNYQSNLLIDDKFKMARSINVFRQKVSDKWQSWLPGERGALMAGIVLGGQDQLQQSTKQALQTVGLNHIVAASGYNLVVVCTLMGSIFTRVAGRRWGGAGELGVTAMYMVVSGMSSSIVRAGIMMLGLSVGKLIGRKSSGVWWLALTCAVMWWCDALIVEDVGWWLSIVATLGLIWLKPAWFSDKETLFGEIQSTVCAIVMTMPIIWFTFGTISWIAVISNSLIVMILPMLMELGMVVTVVGLMFDEAGRILSYLMWPGTTWILWSSRRLAEVFGGSWQVPKLQLWGVVMWYVVVVGGVWIKKKLQDT